MTAYTNRYCSAVIEMVSVDGKYCSVKFDSYGISIMTKLSDLQPLSLDEEESEKQSRETVRLPMAK